MKFLKNKLNYLLIFIFTFLTQLFVILLSPTVLLWDENVYIANAKYVLGIGKYFEYFRFPLLWWILIPLVSIFKESFLIYRLFISLIFSISVIFLYKLFESIEKNNLKILFFILLIILNGLILFWGNKVYPDILSVSFLIFSIYFYYKFLEKNLEKDLILYSLFGILSFLSKYPFGIWLFTSWLFLDKNKKIKATIYFIIFLIPFFLYNLINYKNPIFIFLEQFRVVYLWQIKEPITKFFKDLLMYLGFLSFSMFLLPKNKFEKSIYLLNLLSFVYFAFFVYMKDPRYLLQILIPSVILFYIKIDSFKTINFFMYLFLGISLFYSSFNGIFGNIFEYILCYGETSSIYQSIVFLKNMNPKTIISNSFWVWYANYLNIEAYSIYSEDIEYLIKKHSPDFIVYSENYGILLNLNLEKFEKIFEYKDFCGIDVKIYKV